MKTLIIILFTLLSLLSCKKNEDPTPVNTTTTTTNTNTKTVPTPPSKVDSNGCVTKAAIKGTWYYYAGNNNGFHLVLATSQKIVFGDSIATWQDNFSTSTYTVNYASDFSTFSMKSGNTPASTYVVTLTACDKLAITYSWDGGVTTYTDSLRQTR